MPQQNLEQLRAAHAIAFWNDAANRNANQGEDGGKVVEKLPSLVLANGLLATAAFAKSKSKVDENTRQYRPSGYERILTNVLAIYVAGVRAGGFALPAGFQPGERTDLDRALRTLVGGSSILLQHVTAESLAYLGYLKRFAPKD